MAKTIRRPITDVYGNDIFTGQKVESYISDRTKQHQAGVKKRFEEKEVVDGKIYVDGLGRVKKSIK